MIKEIPFDIDEIMKQTAPQYIGERVNKYCDVYVATFYINEKEYSLYTIVDLNTEYKNLVVVDESLTIINEIK